MERMRVRPYRQSGCTHNSATWQLIHMDVLYCWNMAHMRKHAVIQSVSMNYNFCRWVAEHRRMVHCCLVGSPSTALGLGLLPASPAEQPHPSPAGPLLSV